jgi:hypothetical protein
MIRDKIGELTKEEATMVAHQVKDKGFHSVFQDENALKVFEGTSLYPMINKYQKSLLSIFDYIGSRLEDDTNK